MTGDVRESKPRGGSRGTSLIELLVVLALLSAMVLVAANLVVHSLQLLGATGLSIRNPLVVQVMARLRNDIQGAFAVVKPDEVWDDGPLVLRTRDNKLVVIQESNGALVRGTTTTSGAALEQRVLLRGVTAWWWRCPSEGVVDLRIAYLINAGSENSATLRAGYAGERRTENLRFAIRGAGGMPVW